MRDSEAEIRNEESPSGRSNQTNLNNIAGFTYNFNHGMIIYNNIICEKKLITYLLYYSMTMVFAEFYTTLTLPITLPRVRVCVFKKNVSVG